MGVAHDVELVWDLAGAVSVAMIPSRSNARDVIEMSPANWFRSSARRRRSTVVKIVVATTAMIIAPMIEPTRTSGRLTPRSSASRRRSRRIIVGPSRARAR
jgi:hypothetical protein